MHSLLTGTTTIGLAATLALLGGWVWSGAKAVPQGYRKVHRLTGLLLIVLSAQRLNGIRITGVAPAETWSMTGLRLAALVLAAAVLAMHAGRKRVPAATP